MIRLELLQDAEKPQRLVVGLPGIADGIHQAFRTRLLDGAPYTYVWLDAITQKVREGGRLLDLRATVRDLCEDAEWRS